MQLRFYPWFSWCAREDVNGLLICYRDGPHEDEERIVQGLQHVSLGGAGGGGEGLG